MGIRTRILTTASAVALAAAPAFGQQTAEPAAQDGLIEEQQDVVTVTGSRIARQDYVADSPVVTLSENTVDAIGPMTLEQTFNRLPQFAAIQGGTSASAAKGGRASANLRGLGIARTLVLLDGKRMQPSDALGTVDLNSLSPALISGVEVITGGASAVYGSDAIAGVVNFQLNKSFSGFQVDAQYGVTSRDDGESFEASVAAGGNYADGRGHAMLSLIYYDREGVFGAARPFFDDKGVAGVLRGGVVTAEANNLPSQAVLNSIFMAKYGSTTAPVRNQAIGVNRDGSLFTSTTPILNLLYPPGDPYIVNEGRVGFSLAETYYLQQPMERWNVFARTTYDLTDSIEAFAQFNYAKYDTSWTRNGNTATSATATAFIPVTNPFVPADLRTILASRTNQTAPINFSFNTGRVGVAVTYPHYEVSQIMGGLTGELFSDWTWEVYASEGETRSSEIQDGYIDRAAWATLVNAADGGASVCPGGFNPFNPDPLQLDPSKKGCYDYLNRALKEQASFEQQIVEATMQGGLLDLPAGKLRFAAGAGYRRNAYDFLPDTARTYRTVYPDQATGPTGGSMDVVEYFGELLIPVIADVPLIKSFELDIAARYSDYSTVGGVSTYKASGNWTIFDGLLLRGGYQRAIRAPSLAELYAPPERSLPQIGAVNQGGGDPCDFTGRYRTGASGAQVRALCLAQGVPSSVIDIFRFTGSAVPAVTSGNTDLNEETADTTTAGIVWQPEFDVPALSNVSMSLDWYDIKVDEAIGFITTQISLQRCFNADGVSNPQYDLNNFFCNQVSRNSASGQIEQIIQPTLNLASYQASGVDFQLDWTVDLADIGVDPKWGSLSFNLVVSWLDQFKIQNLQGQPFVDYSGTIGNMQVDPFTLSYPEWKASGSLTWNVGPASLAVVGRHYSAMDHFSNVGVANPTLPGVNPRDYFDLTGSWDFGDGLELRAGIVNLFDIHPPEWTTGSVADPALYDLLQRRYYVGVKKKF